MKTKRIRAIKKAENYINRPKYVKCKKEVDLLNEESKIFIFSIYHYDRKKKKYLVKVKYKNGVV